MTPFFDRAAWQDRRGNDSSMGSSMRGLSGTFYLYPTREVGSVLSFLQNEDSKELLSFDDLL